jgi:thiamine-monophosphate kinase
VRERLERPQPRLALGRALRGLATAAADVSDGLLGDLGHILQASGAGACVDVHMLMQSAAVSPVVRGLDSELALTCVLAGGDDYELVFTAPPSARVAVAQAAAQAETPVTRIGHLEAGPARVRLLTADGSEMPPRFASFDHFSESST